MNVAGGRRWCGITPTVPDRQVVDSKNSGNIGFRAGGLDSEGVGVMVPEVRELVVRAILGSEGSRSNADHLPSAIFIPPISSKLKK